MDSKIFDSSLALHGFTPVRRRECDETTRLQGQQEMEWTTARCHRLLRALTSRVAVLRKELCTIHSGSVPTDTNAKDYKSKPRPKTSYPNDDADWGKIKRKVRQTYSGRVRKRNLAPSAPKTPRVGNHLMPGEILVATPILARARGDIQQEQGQVDNRNLGFGSGSDKEAFKKPGPSCAKDECDQGVGTSGILRALKRTDRASRYAIYEGIYNGLGTLLKSTKEPTVVKKGPRSLMSMCVRAVPGYIKHEETALLGYAEETGTKSAIDTRDISTEIYDYLEQFGCGEGWKGIRELVRMHGIQLLVDAIKEGLFSTEFCGILVTLCIRSNATVEGDSLISALLSSGSFPAPRTISEPLPTQFAILWKYTEETGCDSFQYQLLANLIASGTLPVSWLATKEFQSVWSGAMHRLSPGCTNHGILAFLDTSVPLLAGALLPGNDLTGVLSTAIDSTFSSLMTTLVSIAFLSTKSPIESITASFNYKHILTLFRRSLVDYKLLCSAEDRSILLLAASLFVEVQYTKRLNEERSCINDLLSRVIEFIKDEEDVEEDETTGYDDLVAFICSIAKCCRRASSNEGYLCLETLHMALNSESKDFEDSSILQGLIVDSALAFAIEVPDQKHSDYASSLDAKFSCRKLKARKETNTKERNPGFRWEDGIGEWVMATPANVGFSVVVPIMDLDDSAMPTQSSPYLGRRKTRRAASGDARRMPSPSPSSSDKDQNNESSESGIEQEVGHEEEDDDSEPEHTFSPVAEGSFSPESTYPSTASSVDDDEEAEIETSPRSRRTRWSLRNNRRQISSESSPSNSSSSSSSRRARPFISRAPNPRRESLRSSQTWQAVDENSEDELSFLSDGSSRRQKTAMPKTESNAVSSQKHRVDQSRPRRSKRQKTLSGRPLLLIADSEDELCM
ncbi:hypothetical protein BJ875DRAFT_416697 [Amylocarpus encephaloides]|uniref:Uncharacterized protein n=1 Tax=Amylocarpus encephaloides TaxID=45428 RepID=A0A9P7YR41_9HELO|nr:hypothetical protein BJ875DRAFT_416697 [Amylocarpus encephaloides]